MSDPQKPRGYGRFMALPPEELALLRQRRQELAKVPPVEEAGELLEILEITSRGQTFAVPLEAVEGIVELTSIAATPRAPPYVRGLVNFHGDALLGVELSSLIGGPTTGFADLRRLIALRAASFRLALLAEKVVAVRSASLQSFRPDSVRSQPYVVGVDDKFVSLLEPQALVEHAFAAIEGAQP